MTFRQERPMSFSPVTLQELQGKFPPADQEPLAGRRSEQQGVMRAAIDYEHDVERAIALKARGYLESDAQRRFRYAQWAALVLSLLFIGSIVVLLAMLCVRLNDVFDSVDGSDTSAKVTTMMDMAVEGAENARMATRNVLHVTQYARQTASMAAPQLERAVNSTNALVNDLRSWSFHPSLSIAPGHTEAG